MTTDPFGDLHAPADPVHPDPAFARRLRARVQQRLAGPRSRPRGVVPVTTTIEPETRVRSAAVPYLAVADAYAAIDWYADVFGASVIGDPIRRPDGRVGHAELAIGDGVLYLADESPDLGVVAPTPGAAAVSLMLAVDDADRVRGRAIDLGADGSRPPYDGYGERHAWIVDPFGHRWGLTSPLRDATARIAYRPGDVTYVSLWLADPERARAFYGAVLGWRFDAAGAVGTTPQVGIHPTPTGERMLFCCYAVDDLDAALGRVRAAGGRAGDAHTEPFGRVANCADDQGTSFALLEVGPVDDGVAPPPNGFGAGDLGYLTIGVEDSAKARAFYGAVLGWTFTPGRHADGWGVTGPAPMTGLAGGNAPGAIPQWLVSDVAAAVAAVRAHGGTATDPVQQPYGMSARCTDDQGLPFYLGQTT